MRPFRSKLVLLNNAFVPAVLRLSRRGQSSLGNAATKTPIDPPSCPVAFMDMCPSHALKLLSYFDNCKSFCL